MLMLPYLRKRREVWGEVRIRAHRAALDAPPQARGTTVSRAATNGLPS